MVERERERERPLWRISCNLPCLIALVGYVEGKSQEMERLARETSRMGN